MSLIVLKHKKCVISQSVSDYLFSLQFVSDWFVMKEQIDIWYDDDYVYNDSEMFNGTIGIKNTSPKKQKLKKSSYPLLGILQDGGIGVSLRMRKKRQKNCF